MEENDDQIIQQLVFDFAKQATKSEQEAHQFIIGLAKVVQEDSGKLVHFGNTLFLILVRGEGVVEIHTMSVNEESVALAKHFVQLAQYLKNIGVKVAYTYSGDAKFAAIAKRTKLPFRTQEMTLPEGEKVTAYFVEF